MSRSGLVLACAALVLVLVPATGTVPASALVAPAQLIDGPSAAIREVGGVSMSADGTGGLVYRKDDGGRPHVFAAQFVGGAWQKPQRVDTGETQRFESSWPMIAAGDGGRLLVVWVQEFGAGDRMFSSSLQPGSRRFEPPVPVDLNVGDSALGTYPALAMAPGGQAYVAYRVITDAQPSSAPPGNVLGEYRLARYTGQLWSGFGTPLNRNLAAAQPTPAQRNRPQIGIDQLGNAVVAWQELDDAFIPRIYARRVFPTSTGIALQVSPGDLAGVPLRAGADQFSLSVAAFGATAIAWRQQPPPGAGAFTRPRILAVQSPNEFSTDAAAFAAPRAIDNGGADGPHGALGAVDVSAGDPSLLVTFGVDAEAFARDADEQTIQDPVRIDAGGATAPLDPVGELGASGAAVLAWKANAGRRGSVVLRERRSDGVTTDRPLSGPRGGQVDTLALAGSGLGDAIAGFAQGTDAGRQVVAGWVDAPPDVFNAQAPRGWLRKDNVALGWDPAVHAIGGVVYDVVIDDDTLLSGLAKTAGTVDLSSVEDGVRTVSVIATDAAGQETTSVPAQLKLDRTPPRARIRVRGRAVTVRLADGAKGRVSGVSAKATVVRFGTGARIARHATATYRFKRPGRHRIVIRTRDVAGNAATLRRTVTVR